jgi:hypothetical protein
MPDIKLVSASNASDLGYRALADLAKAAGGMDYRVIGGHMVQMLLHVYPTPSAELRGTADADAGIAAVTAAGLHLHDRLVERGYDALKGNHYRLGDGDFATNVDLLVPGESPGTTVLGGRAFDVAPGLGLAMNSTPLVVHAEAFLVNGDSLDFTVLVPNLECAVVMKTLVRSSRLEPKDLSDLASLLEVAYTHRASGIPWGLGEMSRVAQGSRMDTARVLYDLLAKIERGQDVVTTSGVNPTRLAALIRNLIAQPPRR